MYKSLNSGNVNIQANGFAQTLALARNHGFGAVSYNPVSLETERIDAFQALDLMGQYGVIISDFGLPVQITGKNEFNKSFPMLEPMARAASRLGIRRCCTWMLSFSNDSEYAENFKRHTDMFRLIAEVLDEYGILLGVEFLGPASISNSGKYPFIHTLKQLMELCGAVGTDNMGVLLDAHHCYCSGLKGGEFTQYIRNEREIVLVHLNDDAPGIPLDDIKDSPRYYPGEQGGGGNDLHGFMGALKQIKYTGPVELEPFSETLKEIKDNEQIAKIISESINSVWIS
ncbi:MAG: sugar phosphate isomerase/epimerase [Oscillospiraceae bacterium]|nr:sugar phosphate isomerase/epimerase [Oscillospiraceae bacterium]